MQQKYVVNVKTQKAKKQSRYSKGAIIAASRQIFKIKGEDSWLVESETTDDKFYRITEDGTCDCMDFQNRGGPCKHVWSLIKRGIV
jgi:hypothetical protein